MGSISAYYTQKKCWMETSKYAQIQKMHIKAYTHTIELNKKTYA